MCQSFNSIAPVSRKEKRAQISVEKWNKKEEEKEKEKEKKKE